MGAIHSHIRTRFAPPFKGDRDYIHGPDVYDAIAGVLRQRLPGGRGTGLRLILHAFVQGAFELTLTPPGLVRTPDSLAVGRVSVEGKDGRWFGTIKDTGRSIEGRVPFDEYVLRRACRIEGSSILCLAPTGLGFMETAVVMTKFLHEQLLPVSNRRWIVCRMDLDSFPEPAETEGLSISLVQQTNLNLTRSQVCVRTRDIGSMFFSAVAP